MRIGLIILFFILTCCNFPKDPEGSLEKVHGDSLKIGVVNNLPYTSIENGNARGIEIDILKEFARSNNFQVKFIEGSETTLVNKLKKYDVHIVAGGFDKKTVWKKHAGMSATYDSKHLFLIPKGENKLLQKLETHILTIKRK